MQLTLLILIQFLFVFVYNFAIHKSFVKKQQTVLHQLSNANIRRFSDISMELVHNSGWQVNRADLIFVDRQLILFVYNGLFRQARQILLFHEQHCKPIITEGITRSHVFDLVRDTGNGFELVCRFEPVYSYQEVRFQFKLNESNEADIFECLRQIVDFN